MGNIFQKKEFWRGEILNTKFHQVRLKLVHEDNEQYQKGYPNKVDDPEANTNYLFFTNQIKSDPEETLWKVPNTDVNGQRQYDYAGDYIDTILNEWYGDYTKLEKHHGYIQWLFPTRERGHNAQAQLLQIHEAEKIIADPEAKNRVLKAYEMMLDFYGLKLVNLKRGTLEKKDHWEERWAFLNGSMHNFLRITRILRSLGELGWEELKVGFVNFLFEEVMINRTLPNAIESLYDYWIPSLRDESHRYVFNQRFATMVKFYPELYEDPKKNKK